MGVSIYYTARRAQGLSPSEQAAVETIVRKYSVRQQIEEYLQTGVGFSGEDFGFYDPPYDGPDTVLEGATKLPWPIESMDDTWEAMQRWCQALSEIRRAVPNAQWHVHVDDADIPWDEERQEYDATM